MHVAHRDIKTSNILIAGSDSFDQFEIAICDFGMGFFFFEMLMPKHFSEF